MRIIFIHTEFRVYWLPRLKYLNDFLTRHRHQLYVLEIAGKGSPYAFSDKHGGVNNRESDNIYWECLFPDRDMGQLDSLNIRKAIFQRLTELHPDIVFAGAIAYPSGANAVAWGTKMGVPVAIFDNARLADVPRSGLVNFVKHRIYANISAMLIPAPSHLADYRFWKIPEEKIHYGLNVIDNDYWQRLSRENPSPQELVQQPYILGVGRQIAKKNWLSVVEAYHRSGVKAKLVLVGNGPERGKIKELLCKLGLEDRVILFDFLPPEKLATLYVNALLLLLSSYGETWGLCVNEAMACGTPVLVSTECGCCETLCIDGVTGWRSGTDVESIANALRRFSHTPPEQYLRIKNNAKGLIGQWGCPRFCDSVLKIAEKCTNGRTNIQPSLFDKLILAIWKGRYRPV